MNPGSTSLDQPSPETAGLIDVSAWTGNWPFTKLRYGGLPELKVKLQSLQVARAFVAPIEAILEQDPSRANKELLAATDDPFWSPVPVIDLSYANWQETFAYAANDSRVKMVKLLPNYHMYELSESKLQPLVALARQRSLVISIQIRVEDVRGQYPLMKVADVDVLQAANIALRFPEQPFLLGNLHAAELREALRAADNVYADLASLEQVDIVKEVEERYPAERVLFATHSPFYFPEAAVYKLRLTEAGPDTVRAIGSANARRLFEPPA
ncbi:amidohydrolase family protein [Paenibacillus cymbidii]|uniref:amidohydrolase family protein n=1 Tax=Paenibacillus cymbidii TaxID=1639034 RepID=UPI0010801DC1|nr:amidohydrolase family protein [Paenibacillus cymbidii]